MQTQTHETADRAPVPIVFTKGGDVFANSRDVAAFFGKAHKHVLADIDRLITGEPSLGLADHGPDFRLMVSAAFIPTLVEVNIGSGATRRDRAYDITRDGFTLLAMGFTGAKALRFKLAYIQAFNAMEARLKEAVRPAEGPPLPPPPPRLDDEFDVSDVSRIRAYSTWVSTVARIYGPAKARALYERLPIPQVHTRDEGAAYELADEDGPGCLAHLLRFSSAISGLSMREFITMAFRDTTMRGKLADFGVKVIPAGGRARDTVANRRAAPVPRGGIRQHAMGGGMAPAAALARRRSGVARADGLRGAQ